MLLSPGRRLLLHDLTAGCRRRLRLLRLLLLWLLLALELRLSLLLLGVVVVAHALRGRQRGRHCGRLLVQLRDGVG